MTLFSQILKTFKDESAQPAPWLDCHHMEKVFLNTQSELLFPIMFVVAHSSPRHHYGEFGSVFSVTSLQGLGTAAGYLKAISSPG